MHNGETTKKKAAGRRVVIQRKQSEPLAQAQAKRIAELEESLRKAESANASLKEETKKLKTVHQQTTDMQANSIRNLQREVAKLESLQYLQTESTGPAGSGYTVQGLQQVSIPDGAERFVSTRFVVPDNVDGAVFPVLMSTRTDFDINKLSYKVHLNFGFYTGNPRRRPFLLELETGYVCIVVERNEVEHAMQTRQYSKGEVESLATEIAIGKFAKNGESAMAELMATVSKSMVSRMVDRFHQEKRKVQAEQYVKPSIPKQFFSK